METGLAIRIDINSLLPVDLRLARLERMDLREMLEGIGAEIESQTRRRLQVEKTSPEGEDWVDWSETYVSRKHGDSGGHEPHPDQLRSAGGHTILQLDGGLTDSIQYDVDDHEVIVGSNLIYARVHQEGFEGIPARPYVGLSDENTEDVEALALIFVEDLLQ